MGPSILTASIKTHRQKAQLAGLWATAKTIQTIKTSQPKPSIALYQPALYGDVLRGSIRRQESPPLMRSDCSYIYLLHQPTPIQAHRIVNARIHPSEYFAISLESRRFVRLSRSGTAGTRSWPVALTQLMAPSYRGDGTPP